MSGLSKNLRTLDQHLRKQNRERSKSPAIGEGTHLLDCVECGRPFRSHDSLEVLCPKCDAEDRVNFPNQEHGEGKRYQFERFKRGGYRD